MGWEAGLIGESEGEMGGGMNFSSGSRLKSRPSNGSGEALTGLNPQRISFTTLSR
jgi:hypothetical protein